MPTLSNVNAICTINGMVQTGFLDLIEEPKITRFFFTVSDRVVSTSKRDSLVFEFFESGSFPGFLSFDQPCASSEERLTLLSEFLKEIAVRKIQPNFYLKLSSDKLTSLTEGTSVDIEDPIPYHYTHPIFQTVNTHKEEKCLFHMDVLFILTCESKRFISVKFNLKRIKILYNEKVNLNDVVIRIPFNGEIKEVRVTKIIQSPISELKLIEAMTTGICFNVTIPEEKFHSQSLDDKEIVEWFRNFLDLELNFNYRDRKWDITLERVIFGYR